MPKPGAYRWKTRDTVPVRQDSIGWSIALLWSCIVAVFVCACGQEEPPATVPQSVDSATPRLTSSERVVDVGVPRVLEDQGVDAMVPTLPPIHFRDLPKDPPRHKVEWSDFVGSEACKDCHADAYEQWKGSTHGRAGGWPTDEQIIPKFTGDVLSFSNASVTLKRTDNIPVFSVRRGGADSREYPVVGVVGRGLIYGGGGQTFFTEADDGRWVLIPFEYNVEKSVWFCQTTGHLKWAPIDGSFPIEGCQWPPSRPLAIEQGPSCQNCHASQIQAQYVPAKDRIETRVKSFSINCESCHGPGGHHVALMTSGEADPEGGIGFESFDTQSKHESMAVCMACHGNKPALRTDYLSGDPLDGFFAQLTLWPVGERKIDFDGRTIGFAYQQGHLYSDCFVNGSMTCVDCHSPHSNAYRDVFGSALEGRFDDGQCTDCHPSKAAMPEKHHRHQSALKCTDCHMPFRQHDTVGEHIRMLRSDHAIPIPRPGSEHGETACKSCHVSQGIPWSASQFEALFGTLKPHSDLARGLFAFEARLKPSGRPRGSQRSIETISALVAQLDDRAPILSIAAMSYLVGEVLSGGGRASPEALDGLWRAASSEDIDVSGAAMATILILNGDDPVQRKALFDALVKQPHRRDSLRVRLVFNLIGADHAYSPLSDSIRRRIRRTMEGDGVQFGVLSESIIPAISMSYLDSGEHGKAMDALQRVADDPMWDRERYSLPLLGGQDRIRFLMAMTESERGRPDLAQPILERLLEDFPKNRPARGMLCQIYESNRKWSEALECFDAMLDVDPESASAFYYQAKILKLMGRHAEALHKVEMALKYAPNQIPAIRLRDDLRRLLGR